MKQIKTEAGFDYWQLRLGINTGMLVAGVVGTRKYAYDVWGDTVNLAARMEAPGQEGKINISKNTWEVCRLFFSCSYRGQIEAKNKGLVDMYFVDSILPELSVNRAGVIPNDLFRQLYEKLHRSEPLPAVTND